METLRPHQLLEQMVCTAFRASADTLNQTSFGDLKQMTTKMGQLYPTMASTLKPLQGILLFIFVLASFIFIFSWVLVDALPRCWVLRIRPFCLCLAANRVFILSEIIEDLRRLCVVFEHVDKLLTVAASLHHKFLQVPRLSEVIFSDYYNFYQPKMGSGSVRGSGDMVNSPISVFTLAV